MSNRGLRFGVIGAGGIVAGYHLPTLLNHPDVEVAMIANHRPESLTALADRFGIPKRTQDFDELIEHPELDAVIIGVPNFLNAELSIKCLEHGKHMLCEKPMAATLEDAERMVRASETSDRRLTIAHVWRSDRDTRWLKEMVKSGRLGSIYKIKLHAVSAEWGPPPGSWRTRKELSGGGALTDVGVHSLDTLAFLFDGNLEIERVYARIQNRFHEMEVEDTGHVLIECGDGMTVHMDAGWYEPNVQSLHGSVEVFGEKGYARTLPAEAFYEVQGQRGRFAPHPPRREQIEFEMYQEQTNRFVASILDGEKSLCEANDALLGIRLLDAAYRSAEAGEFVEPRTAMNKEKSASVG